MLSIWKSVLPNLFLNLCAVWIQFGAIWINLKTLSVKWRSHCLGLTVLTYCGQFFVVSIWQSTLPNQFIFKSMCSLDTIWCNLNQFENIVCKMTVTLSRPDCVNILWTILCSLHLAEYVTKSISKFRRNVNKILFSHYRLENGGHISRPQCANTLLLKQNSFYFADDILKYIFEFVLLLHRQLWYLKMNLKSWSAKYRPCLCLDVLIRCGRDKVTSILKTTFSISFLTSGEIWNGSHVSAAILWGRDKMVPLSRWYIQINFPVWNCFIIFFLNLT